MSTNAELKLQVIQYLKQLPICKPNSTETQWVVRCPYCGDSTKSFDHGHFSILIDINSDKPMLYRCLRCNESGILGKETLEDLNIIVSAELEHSLKTSFRRTYNAEYYNARPMNYQIPDYSNSASNLEKIYYLNSRLETDITLNDANFYRLIPSIKEFMASNKIYSIPDVYPKTLDLLERDYLGFLSSNRNRIVFRNIRPNSNNIRYFKVVLNSNNVSKNTFFALPGSFDLLYTDNVNIHIAEGTFDIISVKNNLPHNESGIHLFYACTGFGYKSVLRYLLAKGINTDLNVHIYADKDKSNDEIKTSLSSQCIQWCDKIWIHRNQNPGEKDYGVSRSKIVDGKIPLEI